MSASIEADKAQADRVEAIVDDGSSSYVRVFGNKVRVSIYLSDSMQSVRWSPLVARQLGQALIAAADEIES